MRKRVQFGIGSSFLTPWDRRTPNGSGLGWEGFTIVSTERQSKNLEFYTENKAWIEIALELLLPLFRNDLSPIEKLSCQFYIASTLLHEFAVKVIILIGWPSADSILALIEPTSRVSNGANHYTKRACIRWRCEREWC